MPRLLNVEKRMVNRELKQLQKENAELRQQRDELLVALRSVPNVEDYYDLSTGILVEHEFIKAMKKWSEKAIANVEESE